MSKDDKDQDNNLMNTVESKGGMGAGVGMWG